MAGEKVPAAGNKLEKFRVMTVAVLGERSAKRFEECRTTNLTTPGNLGVETLSTVESFSRVLSSRRRESVVDFIGQWVKRIVPVSSRNAIFLASDFLTFQITPFRR